MSMSTLDYLCQKYDLNPKQRKMPIEIPNTGRNQFTEVLAELGFEVGVEVGVAHGKYSKIIMENNPQLKRMYGVDPYEPHRGYRDYTHRTTFEALESDAHKALDQYENYIFIKKYSHEASQEFDDESLDFVYLDGDHCFEAVVADIASWLPKVKKGGILFGDDYFRSKGNARIHVVDAVQGYTHAWGIRPWFVIGSQAKIPGQIRDSGRSWMWVKS